MLHFYLYMYLVVRELSLFSYQVKNNKSSRACISPLVGKMLVVFILLDRDIRTENNQRDCVGNHCSYVLQGVLMWGAEFFS